MEREFIHGTWQKNWSFSPAVITSGNDQKIIWLAGYGAPHTRWLAAARRFRSADAAVLCQYRDVPEAMTAARWAISYR